MASFNFNKVILGGRLTSDPELRQTPSGVSATSFSIAVNRPYSKNQEQQKADFINCVAWRNTAEFITKYFKKGSSICVTGSIQNRSWTDNNGQKRYATDVVVSDATFVDGKNDSGQASEPADAAPVGEAPSFEELEDSEELPF